MLRKYITALYWIFPLAPAFIAVYVIKILCDISGKINSSSYVVLKEKHSFIVMNEIVC